MVKYQRPFQVNASIEGRIVESIPFKYLDGYFLKYTFTNTEYQTIIDSFTKENEFSVEHFNSLETLYNNSNLIGVVNPQDRSFQEIFKQFLSFIDTTTLVYKDHIDAEYNLFIYVTPETANLYPLLFRDNSILDITFTEPTEFSNYLYYSVIGKKDRFNELRIYEYFDVQSFLETL